MQTSGTVVDNKFIGGLKTDFTGLNFPDNSCSDADNVTFDLIGNVTRREGINYESNHTNQTVDRTGKAISSFVWTNVGGDGNTKILVKQIGSTLYFYRLTDATVASPLSTTLLGSTITLTAFSPSGGSSPAAVECQYTSGNGFLFVFNPNLEPFYCTYNAGTITATIISVQIRDTVGIPENGVPDNYRSTALSADHNYNLLNQGWSNSADWASVSLTTNSYTTGSKTFTVSSGLAATAGDAFVLTAYIGSSQARASGTVTSYSGTTLIINIAVLSFPGFVGQTTNFWLISKLNGGLINNWHTALSNYPSNSDVWWRFKNTTQVFDPATTAANVTLASSPAAKGSFILSAFDQNRSAISGVAGLTTVTTLTRPRTGAWFQGRVWFTGVDASFQATGDAPYSTWTENIYFSQIVERPTQFGMCYDVNDPTSESLFDLLPTDGGVITIQGSGSIYELFPIQNGMLVRAANGIWFITGSQGIGFTANDYTITKISEVRSISSTSSVNVDGYPIFWNEEGIYKIAPSKQGGLEVTSITVGVIGSLYNAIPLSSKKFARGVYNPLDYTVQWLFRSVEETGVTDRYEFNRILNFNTITSAFYTWTVLGTPKLNGINYVVGPGGSTSPPPVVKFIASNATGGSYTFSFAQENDTIFIDFGEADFISYFITGYRVYGKGNTLGGIPYIDIHSQGSINSKCRLQARWDYATAGSLGGRWSTTQQVVFDTVNRSFETKRRRVRGQGRAVQLKFESVPNYPMSLIGWSTFINVNKIP